METSGGELAGAEIGRRGGLASGTLYPILIRLENLGWLTSRWEIEEPEILQRPRRRFYMLTGYGRTRAVAAFEDLRPAPGRLAWA